MGAASVVASSLLLLAQSCLASELLSSLSNVAPRRDVTGAIVDAHDGNVLQVPHYPGVFFWYAAGYGPCLEPNSTTGCANGFNGCGFLNNHSVNLFTSYDLTTWTPHGNVLPEMDRVDKVLFSPKAIYNPGTNEYVLWYNYVPGYSYGVAVAATPFGPFVTVNATAGSSFQYGYPTNTGVGDFSLLLDDDGAAYMLYSANHHCQIERLEADFLSSSWASTGATSGVLPHGNEAPALFKRGPVYWALVSESCCYCREGAKVHAFSAAAPLGPWSYVGEIAAGSNPFNGSVATSSQQTAVFSVTGTSSTSFMWVGDRWQSAPDRLKAHDFTFWEPLSFSADGKTVSRLTWQDSVTVDVAPQTPAARARLFPPRGFNPCNGVQVCRRGRERST